MQLYNLGKVAWQESQLIYHALADLGRESLVLVSPASPYVCIGYHQDVSLEVDLDFCRTHNIPIFRREVGGGAVYLDGNQLFFQLILRRDNPKVPPRKDKFYRKFLQPAINVYRRIGIPAEYKPVNDIIVGTRKISGTGVGEIGDCIVFVGNLILDFDYEKMAQILKVPDEKFRDKIHKTMKDNLTTIRRELNGTEASQWDEQRLNALMVEEFEALLGQMDPHEKDAELREKMDELGCRMMNDTWLHQKGRRVDGRSVKIRSGVKLIHKMHKAPGGLLRADIEISEGRFENVSISGDFFCYPEDAVRQIESRLEGKRGSEIYSVMKGFYHSHRIETPGIGIEDWLEVLEV
ncbi:MAG: lipoate--protein ligase family protein [Desulfobacteraceae bacterium]|nr:lipoate--protein ligase family protein [Desulfobacteraceae bacterium]